MLPNYQARSPFVLKHTTSIDTLYTQYVKYNATNGVATNIICT